MNVYLRDTDGELTTGQVNASAQLVDVLLESGIAPKTVLNSLTRMNYRAVISSPEMKADSLEGRICQFFR